MIIDHEALVHDPALKDIKEYSRAITSHLGDDYDAVIGITGKKGTGKSTLGIWLSYLINPTLFSIEENIILEPDSESFIKKFEALPRYSGIVGDESAWYAYNRTFMKTFQIYLMQYLKTCRKRHNKAIILCMTSIHKFDKDLRTGDTMYNWVHLLDRGLGAVFQSSNNFFSNDGFRIKENEKLFEEWKGRRKDNGISIEELTNFLEERASNFIDIIQFPDIPAEWKKTYLDLTVVASEVYKEHREKMKLEGSVRAEKRYDSLCLMADWIHEGDDKFAPRTLEEIADRLQVAPSTVLRWVNDAEKLTKKEE